MRISIQVEKLHVAQGNEIKILLHYPKRVNCKCELRGQNDLMPIMGKIKYVR